ncbi:sugar ABC transporter permease [Marisediminicola senii]|uniref:sugar ABC transporter permease n=1 Tax=Marisediminicola senii TaxID=2711233 RepID=UPI0013ED6136|nr:sugar ABC transporter permease [Marisediminicola senii]
MTTTRDDRPAAAVRSTRQDGGGAPRKKKRAPNSRRAQLMFALPAAIFLAVLSLYPMLQLFRMSVSAVGSATLNRPWEFVGLDNFAVGLDE